MLAAWAGLLGNPTRLWMWPRTRSDTAANITGAGTNWIR
jgi:hypothetical protein